MEVRSPRVQEWGGVVWGIAAAALLIGGIPESLLTRRISRVQHQGPRNSTDAVLQPILGPANATEEVRRLLQEAPGAGPMAILYSKEFDHFSEAAMSVSVVAWPSEAWIIPWDGSEAVRRRLSLVAHGRRFFIGPEVSIPGGRFEQLGTQFWSVRHGEAR